MQQFEQELLLEKYLRSQGMSKYVRDFYMTLLLNTKDVLDSDHAIGNRNFEIFDMTLIATDDSVIFSGLSTNGTENRTMDGEIRQINNGFYVATTVQSFGVQKSDEDEELYNVYDMFYILPNETIRKSHYSIDPFFDETEMNQVEEKTTSLGKLETISDQLYDCYGKMIARAGDLKIDDIGTLYIPSYAKMIEGIKLTKKED